VAEGLGCKAILVQDPAEIGDALRRARAMATDHRVPVIVEVILEKVTNIAMGTELHNVNEFGELAEVGADAPTALMLLD